MGNPILGSHTQDPRDSLRVFYRIHNEYFLVTRLGLSQRTTRETPGHRQILKKHATGKL